MRETFVTPRGLITQPNKYGQYPLGAMSRALNVCMRDPGILGSLPDTRAFHSDVLSNGCTLRSLFPMATNVLAYGDSAGTWLAKWVSSGASTAIAMPTGFTLSFDTGRALSATIRGRTLSATSKGVLVYDSEGDTNPRCAGLPPPHSLVFSNYVTTDAATMATAKTAAWRVVFVRKFSDGYSVVSAPSFVLRGTNNTGFTVDPVVAVKFPDNANIVAGDTIELYRTKQVASGTDPGNTMRLARSYVITATDILNGVSEVRDISPDDALGEELYTNPGQEGSNQANYPPPQADDLCVFKGYTLFASPNVNASNGFRINATTGTLTTAAERKNGIGKRTVTGDFVNGSNQIQNISDTTGVVVGQIVNAAQLPGNATIQSVVGTTVTVDLNATATSVGASVDVFDVIEINGGKEIVSAAGFFLSATIARDDVYVISDDYKDMNVFPSGDQNQAGLNVRFVVPYYHIDQNVTLRATNENNYSPPLANINDTPTDGGTDNRPNRVHFSKWQEPEHVPALNYFFVGSGTIYRMVATRDSVLVFCSDGLWRISGGGATAEDWRVDPVDPTLILAARGAVCVLNDVVWAYTNRGLVAIVGDEAQEVSTGVLSEMPGAVYADSWDTFMAADELHREIWLTFRANGGGSSTSYVFNTLTKSFVTVSRDEQTALAYSRALQSLVIGKADTNPDILYFYPDSSSNRHSGTDVSFQPMVVDDPNTLKQFTAATYRFAGVGSAIAISAEQEGALDGTVDSIAANSLESAVTLGVPRAFAMATRLSPGFTLGAGSTTNAWSLRSVSVQWSPLSEESKR